MNGMVRKESTPISPQEMEQINRYTRRPLDAGEVYTFSVVLCDNEVDRDFERFDIPALETLKEMFLGKTGIFDHAPKAENQAARIYDVNLESDPVRRTQAGEAYTRLVAKAYLPRCEKTQALILEIDSGMKKEVSVGCSVARRECSICGAERAKKPCKHRKGMTYLVDGAEQVCHDVLREPTDAYEWSFVAVPAQREAGVIKSFFPRDKQERSMRQVLKELEQTEQEVVLSREAVEQLLSYIDRLDELAGQGREYRDMVAGQVLRLSHLVQPEVSTDVMKRVTASMSLEDLQEFEKAFSARAGAMLPMKPQFAPPEGMHTVQHREFQI